MKRIFDDVVTLTVKYGGLLWGEYGKGFHAEYSPTLFGDKLYREPCKVRSVSDP